ncbi:hypothetical protein [Achromobacter xylosoxidans]|uniref:hypothetical protein n=1 Tax=Alcaligenes xylosoxydans xylosoxydans TaxID=85698 RepID=UPI001F12A26C|nr:hypothetical protein [Achromobacter xylosoxidans]
MSALSIGEDISLSRSVQIAVLVAYLLLSIVAFAVFDALPAFVISLVIVALCIGASLWLWACLEKRLIIGRWRMQQPFRGLGRRGAQCTQEREKKRAAMGMAAQKV